MSFESGNLQLNHNGDLWIASFDAMASPCEILIDTTNKDLAEAIAKIAQQEALRIQKKFSRYEANNIVWKINNAGGSIVYIDDETKLLLDFAHQCHKLSNGLFDVTSGRLRRVWKFDGGNKLPSHDSIEAEKKFIGWEKVSWQNFQLQMPTGMEIDFGGIGKEYAVDRALLLSRQYRDIPVLINFGGDLAVSGARLSGDAWNVGIENPDNSQSNDQRTPNYVLTISAGALATSGDSRRYLLHDGVRYSHILNPFTGWPILDAPRSVTVASSSCIQAGMLATFALLNGIDAEQFLRDQNLLFWCLR